MCGTVQGCYTWYMVTMSFPYFKLSITHTRLKLNNALSIPLSKKQKKKTTHLHSFPLGAVTHCTAHLSNFSFCLITDSFILLPFKTWDDSAVCSTDMQRNQDLFMMLDFAFEPQSW